MPTIRHAVYFTLKNRDSAEDAAALVAGLKEMAAIEMVRELVVGQRADTEERGVVATDYDVTEMMTFDSLADQDAYQVHPMHKAFIEKCGHLWSKVQVFDTVDLD